MSEEDFLKRWSRRKREVAEAEKPVPDTPAHDAKTCADIAAQPTPDTPEPEFDPATLPPVESITSVSDITAFLRAGVPADLTRAALRRAWTADPAIRDFIGLAENAWDFTDPTAMPGFGPLESTDEVRRMIAQVVDKIGQSAEQQVAEVHQLGVDTPENSNASNVVEAPEPDNRASSDVGSEGDDTTAGAAEKLDNQVLLQSNKEDVAMQRDVTEASKKPEQLSHRIHGTALPR